MKHKPTMLLILLLPHHLTWYCTWQSSSTGISCPSSGRRRVVTISCSLTDLHWWYRVCRDAIAWWELVIILVTWSQSIHRRTPGMISYMWNETSPATRQNTFMTVIYCWVHFIITLIASYPSHLHNIGILHLKHEMILTILAPDFPPLRLLPATPAHLFLRSLVQLL